VRQFVHAVWCRKIEMVCIFQCKAGRIEEEENNDQKKKPNSKKITKVEAKTKQESSSKKDCSYEKTLIWEKICGKLCAKKLENTESEICEICVKY